MMLVELQSSRCFIVSVLLVFVKVTVSSPSSMCEQVLHCRRELHLCDSHGALVESLLIWREPNDPGGFWVYGS